MSLVWHIRINTGNIPEKFSAFFVLVQETTRDGGTLLSILQLRHQPATKTYAYGFGNCYFYNNDRSYTY